MDKKSFLIYLDYEEQFDLLSDEQIGQLMRAIIKYEKTGEEPELDGMLKMAFSFIRKQLDRDRDKWEDTKNKRSEAGKKGMANRWKKDNKNNNDNNVITNDNKNNNVINDITKITVKDKVNVKVKDNVNVDVDVINNNAVEEITKCYEENIGLITPATAELLFSYLDDMEYGLIIRAIKIASIKNKRSGDYIRGILNDWNRKGIKTVLDAENEQNQFNRKEQQEETEEEKKKRKIKELEESMKDDW